MKIIKVLIIVIVILLIIFGIKVSGIKIFKQKDELSLEQIKEIIAKSENITNYTCKYNDGEQDLIRKYNKNKELVEKKEEKYYMDYGKNETVGIKEDKKIAFKTEVLSNDIISQQRKSLNELLDKTEEYKYIGEENYNGIDCIIIELKNNFEELNGWYWNLDIEKTNKEYKNEKIINRIWIAKEEGVIIKNIVKIGEEEKSQEYEYEFNSVSDEEVKVPDLSGYKLIESNL